MKIAFCTLGCKVNQYETEAMREIFQNIGYEIVDENDNPDVFVLNSCTVTAESDRKTRQTLRHIRKQNPSCITVLCGCMAQAFPDEAYKLDAADIVFGNTDHKRIPQLVEQFLNTRERVLAVEKHEQGEKFCTPSISAFSGRTRAYMKIEDGCNRFCSYCAIPYGRGRVRSRSVEDIGKEAERLSQNGFCEIVLVGINLSAYGFDNGLTLCDAVSAASKPDGIKRVRLGSLEPDHITDDILAALFANPKFCPQFHLSLQSGCNETLKRMNRHYTAEFYEDLVERIRAFGENAAVTTDVMVGFSGETDDEFKESLAFVKKIGFSKCHVFAYSVRNGTAAAKLEGKITRAVKSQRSEEMIRLAEQLHNEFLKKSLNIPASLLVETQKDGVCEGYTENYTRVQLESDKYLSGDIVKILPYGIKDDMLLAKEIKEESEKI